MNEELLTMVAPLVKALTIYVWISVGVTLFTAVVSICSLIIEIRK